MSPFPQQRSRLARLAARLRRERRLPPEYGTPVRDALTRAAARLRGWLPGSARRRAAAADRDRPGAYVATAVDGSPIVARAAGDADPGAATTRAEAFRSITAELDDAGITFEVREGPDVGPTLMIDLADRRRLHRALRRAGRPERHLRVDAGPLRPLGRRTPGGSRWFLHDALAFGPDAPADPAIGVTFEFWFADGPVKRRYRGAGSERIDATAPAAQQEVAGVTVPVRRSLFRDSDLLEPDFAIDVVYTWVDRSDPEWQDAFASTAGADAGHRLAVNDARYTDHGELRYSLRSLERHAPFVAHIYVVTAGQRPAWLLESDTLTIVDHRDILDERDLPTFNSHAIETALHRIDDLAEHYLYLNDDVFLLRPTPASTYFVGNGLWRFFPDDAVLLDGPVRSTDALVDAAAKNGRDLIEQAFSRRPVHKLRHAPHPQRRSVNRELEDRFAAAIETTRAHRVRHPGDVSVASFLSHWFGYVTARAVPAEFRAVYVNVHARSAPYAYRRLLAHRDAETVCCNETDADPARAAVAADALKSFLEAAFPGPGRHERRTLTPRGRPSSPLDVAAGSGASPTPHQDHPAHRPRTHDP